MNDLPTAASADDGAVEHVMSLREGDAVVVHTREMRAYVRVLIADLRTATFLRSINVLHVRDRYDLDRLRGWRGQIVVEHEAEAHFRGTDESLWTDVRRMAEACAARLAAKRGAA